MKNDPSLHLEGLVFGVDYDIEIVEEIDQDGPFTSIYRVPLSPERVGFLRKHLPPELLGA